MKLLAAAANERWASMPSALDPPAKPQTLPIEESQDQGEHAQSNVTESEKGLQGKLNEKRENNPWTLRRDNPGGDWQPAGWKPGLATRQT
jgi:hypothetical protein